MSNQNLDNNKNELTEEERALLADIVRHHIIKLIQEARQNELIINNEPLRCQYTENYIVLLRTQNIGYYDKVRTLKRLINKIKKEEVYSEEELK